jgi:hypothetical protein
MSLVAAWTAEAWVRDESPAADPARSVTERLGAMSPRELNRAYRIAVEIQPPGRDEFDGELDHLIASLALDPPLPSRPQS